MKVVRDLLRKAEIFEETVLQKKILASYSLINYNIVIRLDQCIYHFSVSLGQEFRHSLPRSFAQGLTRLQSKCQLGCAPVWRLDCQESASSII